MRAVITCRQSALALAVAVAATALLTSTAIAAAPAETIFGAQLAGTSYNAKSDSRGLMQLFEHTVSNKTWKQPGFPWTEYAVPDQFTLLNLQETETRLTSVLSSTYESAVSMYFSWNIFHAFVPLIVVNFADINAHELANIKLEISMGEKMYGWSQWRTKVYQLNVAPPDALTLTSEFKTVLEALPTTLDSTTEAAYEQFVERVGTHYICKGTFGGVVNQISYLNATIAADIGLSFTGHQMVLLFTYELFALFAADFKSKTDIDIDAKFSLNVNTHNFFHGGDPQYQAPILAGFWKDSVATAPALIGSTFCPITDLLDDYPQQQTNLEGFIKTYLGI